MQGSFVSIHCEECRVALATVLASTTFSRAPRSAALLRYVCEKYFEGEADQIKEYNLAIDVLARAADFDQSQDAIVRVEMHRLRKKLAEYYQAEGANQPWRIELQKGCYVPEFVHFDSPPAGEDGAAHDIDLPRKLASEAGMAVPKSRRGWLLFLAAGGIAAAGLVGWWLIRSHSVGASRQNRDTASDIQPASAGVPGANVRIRCGYTKGDYIDPSGAVWQSDEFFQGGATIERPRQFISSTNDPALYQTARVGQFSYRIPLRPGTYELRLHFVEADFGPGLPAEGGEQSRLFNVTANGKPLLTNFDVFSDANGSGIANVRVFKDIRPDENGFLHLRFFNRNNSPPPLLTAVEVVPGRPHELLPIRLTMRDSWFTDISGTIWGASNYESGGRISRRRQVVTGAADPRLYMWERYGHFSYAIPVDRSSSYTLRLFFAETYIGVDAEGGSSKRVFNVFCNGETLLRNFDMFHESGAGCAIVKSFHGLRPDAQGKLVLTFQPIVNYASLFAMEVLDETNRLE